MPRCCTMSASARTSKHEARGWSRSSPSGSTGAAGLEAEVADRFATALPCGAIAVAKADLITSPFVAHGAGRTALGHRSTEAWLASIGRGRRIEGCVEHAIAGERRRERVDRALHVCPAALVRDRVAHVDLGGNAVAWGGVGGGVTLHTHASICRRCIGPCAGVRARVHHNAHCVHSRRARVASSTRVRTARRGRTAKRRAELRAVPATEATAERGANASRERDAVQAHSGTAR